MAGKRGRTWKLSDLTEDNIALWGRIGWPYGIKADLAREIGDLEKQDGEIYRKDLGDFTYFIINRSGDGVLRMGRYFVCHPSGFSKGRQGWTQGKGFSIPMHVCTHWRTGIGRLFAIPDDELAAHNRTVVYEIDYGSRGEEGYQYHCVRFFIELKGEEPYYQIQDFASESRRGTNRLICEKVKDKEIFPAIDDALRHLEAEYNNTVTYAKDYVKVTVTTTPEGYD